jgi:hypothetical protein
MLQIIILSQSEQYWANKQSFMASPFLVLKGCRDTDVIFQVQDRVIIRPPTGENTHHLWPFSHKITYR